MRFYHRFHVILAFTLTAYGSSITYASKYIRIYTTYYLPVCFLEQRLMIFQRESYCTSHLFTLNKSGKNASQNETYYLPLLTKYMRCMQEHERLFGWCVGSHSATSIFLKTSNCNSSQICTLLEVVVHTQQEKNMFQKDLHLNCTILIPFLSPP